MVPPTPDWTIREARAYVSRIENGVRYRADSSAKHFQQKSLKYYFAKLLLDYIDGKEKE
jgi:hypothetical protein